MAIITRTIGRVQGNSLWASLEAMTSKDDTHLQGTIVSQEIAPLINDLIINIADSNVYQIEEITLASESHYLVTTSKTPLFSIRGIQGIQGEQGVQGVKGDKGDVGPQGPIGLSNTITIGEVKTLSSGEPATATLTGESPNQVLNLGLPRGDTGAGSVGPQGPQGEQGPQGPAGTNGKTPTMSLESGNLIATFN